MKRRDRSRALLSRKLGESKIEEPKPKPWYKFRFLVKDFVTLSSSWLRWRSSSAS